jgi:hypothetical protein
MVHVAHLGRIAVDKDGRGGPFHDHVHGHVVSHLVPGYRRFYDVGYQ